jgi:hypothetical protein
VIRAKHCKRPIVYVKRLDSTTHQYKCDGCGLKFRFTHKEDKR